MSTWTHAGLPSTPSGNVCVHMIMKSWLSLSPLLPPEGVWPDYSSHEVRPRSIGFVGAAARIAESYNTALYRAVNQPVLLLGDFNSCDLSDHQPTLHQYVDCPTRLARTLDKCYGNIPDAYKSICRPALGNSDHNVVHLLPCYRAKLRREKTVTKEIEIWTKNCMEEMKCELETTSWLFLNSCVTLNELIDTFTLSIV